MPVQEFQISVETNYYIFNSALKLLRTREHSADLFNMDATYWSTLVTSSSFNSPYNFLCGKW